MKRVWLIPSRPYAALQILTGSPLPGATLGVAYSQGIVANGGTPPYSWSMPATNGFTIDPPTGIISSPSPIAAGITSLSVTVTDSLGAHVTQPFSVTVAAAGAQDFYPGGVVVPDPYAALATWYVDGVAGVDAVGHQAAGYTYKTYGAALQDVFYAGNPGNRRIIIKPTVTYSSTGTYGGTQNAFFPSGGPDAAHPCVVQGDPSNTTLPSFDGQAWTDCPIITISNAAQARVTFGNPFHGPVQNPFVVGQVVTIAGVAGTKNVSGMWKFTSGTTVVCTVQAIGGSPGAWTININVNSTIDGVDWFAYAGGVGSDGAQVFDSTILFCVGNQNGFGTQGFQVNNVVMRKLSCDGSISSFMYVHGGSIAVPHVPQMVNWVVEYCNFSNWYYAADHPSGTCAVIIPRPENVTSNWTFRNCKFINFGAYVNESYGGAIAFSSANNNPFHSYGTDNVVCTNNLFINCNSAWRMKIADASSVGNPGGNCNFWSVTNNIFAGNHIAIDLQAGYNNNPGIHDFSFTGNLVYGPVSPQGSTVAFVQSGGMYNLSYGLGFNITWANNTYGQDITGNDFGWEGGTGITVRDNLCLGGGTHVYAPDPTDGRFIFVNGGTTPTFGSGSAIITFAQIDYNAYAQGRWDFRWHPSSTGVNNYTYANFSGVPGNSWQTAFSQPHGPYAPTPPSELSVTGDPDPHGLFIPNLSVTWNTTLKNMADPNYATSRNYTIAVGSPLLTASSTGGRVGYDPSNSGPGW